MMPILVKGNDVKSGAMAKARRVTGSMGISGFKTRHYQDKESEYLI